MTMTPRAPVKELEFSESGVLDENDVETIDGGLAKPQQGFAGRREIKLVWLNITLFVILHLSAVYGLYLFLTAAQWKTLVFATFLYYISGFGITAGAHRLWAHKSYKAKFPLRVLLMIFNTIAFQDSAMHWARDHRVHHKYSETDADPHNATRGFFFSHIGWLLCKKHPAVKEAGSKIDISDLKADPVLQFQHKYYNILMPMFCFVLPSVIPVVCWGETLKNAFFVAAMFRYTFFLNATWCVNSAAHIWGNKSYDKNINPVQNPSVAVFALGEGWHNYHHVFPWDYKTAELGNYEMNFTTAFIDFFAKIGWAYDLKTVSPEIIKKRVERTGDGTFHPQTWGWGDRDQHRDERRFAHITNTKKQ